MKNRLQFNRHYAVSPTREEALTALIDRITEPGFIPLIGEPMVFRYNDESGKTQVILAIGKKTSGPVEERYHIVDTADLDEKIAAEVAAREALDAETIKRIIFDGVENTFEDNVATLSVSANSIPIGPYEEYEGRANTPHPIHDDYSLLEAVKQVDTNFISFLDDTNAKIDGIHIVKVTSGLDVNVREAYDLVNLSGNVQPNSERILIYKDSSLYNVYLGHTDDRLDDYSSPVVTPGTGDTALCFIYLKADSTYQLVAVNVEDFLQESEFEDGLVVNNHVVKVKIDRASESFLTVGPDGVKLAGVQDAIDAAKQEEEDRATAVEDAIQEELDITQAGAGLDTDGSYIHDHQTNYIGEATSLANADHLLDSALKAESDRATASEGTLQDNIDAEESRASTAEATLQSNIDVEVTRATTAENTLQSNIDAEESRATAAETTLQENIDAEQARATAAENTLQSNIDTEVSARTGADAAIQAELDATQVGAGLAADGSYIHDHLANYIDEATSLANADHLLDAALKTESDRAISAETAEAARATASEGTLQDNIDAEETRATAAESSISGAVDTLSAETVSEITNLNNKIDSEEARATAAEVSISGAVNTLSAATISEIARLDAAIASGNTNVDALSGAVVSEIARAENAEQEIQSELDATQTGAGLAADGSYIHDHPTTYIGVATSLANADHLLDTALKGESDRAIAAEGTLQDNVDDEKARAIAAENFISAATKNEIDRATATESSLQNAINAEQTRAQNAETVLDTKISGLSAGTVSEVARLDSKIDTESQRATAAENDIDNKIDGLCGVTAAFSSATVSEIARIDSSIAGNKVKSARHTLVVTELADGTNLEANVDGKTILTNNGALKTGLKFVGLPAGELEANVREAFKLADAQGTPVDNTTIKIYKSSSLERIELVNVGGVDYIRITYIDNSGLTQTMDLNIQQLVFEAEFKDGLSVNGNHEVKVEIDPTSESYLTVSSNGVKLSGVQNAVDVAVATETARATAAENSISGNVATLSGATVGGLQCISGVTDNVINACGLNMGQQGGYIPHGDTHYISNARNLDQADVLLDQAIWAVSGSILAVSGSAAGEVAELENKLSDLSGVTRSFSSHTVSEIEALKVSVSANTGVLTLTMNGVEQGKYSPSASTTINLEAIQEITGDDVLLTGYEIATGTTLEELIVKDTDTVNEAFGKIQKQIFDCELVTSEAFNDINDRIIELSGNSMDPSDYYTKEEVDDVVTKKQFSTASSVASLTFEKSLTVITVSNATSTALTITSDSASWGLADGEAMEAHVIIKNNNSSNGLTVTLPTSDSRVRVTGSNQLLIDPNGIGEINAIITREGNTYTIYLITS